MLNGASVLNEIVQDGEACRRRHLQYGGPPSRLVQQEGAPTVLSCVTASLVTVSMYAAEGV
jgi:hypothetical protein